MSACRSHQYHVTCGDVHVWVGGLLAPGWDAAPGRGADGWTDIAELGWRAVDPGGDGLWAFVRGFDSHTLPAQLLQERAEASNPLQLSVCSIRKHDLSPQILMLRALKARRTDGKLVSTTFNTNQTASIPFAARSQTFSLLSGDYPHYSVCSPAL